MSTAGASRRGYCSGVVRSCWPSRSGTQQVLMWPLHEACLSWGVTPSRWVCNDSRVELTTHTVDTGTCTCICILQPYIGIFSCQLHVVFANRQNSEELLAILFSMNHYEKVAFTPTRICELTSWRWSAEYSYVESCVHVYPTYQSSKRQVLQQYVRVDIFTHENKVVQSFCTNWIGCVQWSESCKIIIVKWVLFANFAKISKLRKNPHIRYQSFVDNHFYCTSMYMYINEDCDFEW